MSEISIQIRRVTERVRQYYQVFGFRPKSYMMPGRAVVRGSRRLGFDEIECVVAETARGTSVGFYPVNTLHGLIYAIPFFLLLLLHGLNQLEFFSNYLTGNEALLGINWLKLFSGNAELDFKFVAVTLFLGLLPLALEIVHQRIRLANLKSRFSFYTRDAIWETREAPDSIIALQTTRSIINHSWLLAIIYFALFSFVDGARSEVESLYNSSTAELFNATTDAFSISVGVVIGLLSADKAIALRKQNARIDKRSRISGGLLERRIDPVLYGIQAAAFTIIPYGLFMSVTFLKGSSMDFAFQLLFFALVGGFITGLVHAEGPLWISMAYGVLIFFSSLIFIFRTGEQPAYAYIVIIQLFILPFPFIIYMTRSFQKVLKKEGIDSLDWMYEVFVLPAIITYIGIKRQRKKARDRYIREYDRDLEADEIENKIRINKEILLDKNSSLHKMAMHYYEILLSYTASFEDDKFIYFPTEKQLLGWWEEKTKKKSIENHLDFLYFIDRVLWDPTFEPFSDEISRYESVALEMAVAIQ
ncbi:MAG: hypothetical protein INQ03_08650 [Candidatus Heimdallarchaeota archaeon]|nr:hypothetical protein [Candidatus Heimdallarchaeota archaeon]